MRKLAILLALLLGSIGAHAQGVKFKQGTTRAIVGGTTDVARTSDYWGFIAWNSAVTGAKTETLPACTLSNNGVYLGVSDERNTAATYPIAIAASSGNVNGSATGFVISSNLGAVILSCDGSNANWVLQAEYSPGTNVRNVTSTSDTILATDNGGLVTYKNASSVGVTLPAASSAGFPDNGFVLLVRNYGPGAVTITPTTSTINDGASTLVLALGQSAFILANGSSNYDVVLIGAGGAGGGTAREVTSGTTDTATGTDYLGMIVWKSATASPKTETLPACASGNNGKWIVVADGQNTAAANSITVSPASGTVGNAAGVVIISNLGAATFTCDAANTNWVVSSEFSLGSNVRAVTSTSDTILSTDNGGLVTYNNASSVAATLPQGGTTTFPANSFAFVVRNYGAGTVTITPTTSTINNGASSLALTQNQGALIFADGAGNYQAVVVGQGSGSSLPTIANCHVLGNATGSSATAQDTALGAGSGIGISCSGGSVTVSNTGGGGTTLQIPQQATVWSATFAPGPVAALPGTTVAGGFVKAPVSSTVYAIMLSTTVAGTCSSVPTISLRKCGTSLTCGSSTDRGSAAVSNTAGTAVDVSVTDAAVAAGDYLAWEFTAGTCSAPPDIQAVATLLTNPGFCPIGTQMSFTTYCNSAMQSLI